MSDPVISRGVDGKFFTFEQSGTGWIRTELYGRGLVEHDIISRQQLDARTRTKEYIAPIKDNKSPIIGKPIIKTEYGSDQKIKSAERYFYDRNGINREALATHKITAEQREYYNSVPQHIDRIPDRASTIAIQ